MNDDAHWIDQTLAGNSAAFGQLVRRYQDRLYNTVLHVVGNAEDARDVVQDAFVQAFLKLETFQRASTFYTWIYRIAVNLAISHRRRRRPVASVEHARESAGIEPVDGGDGPTEPLERDERCRQVRAAISRLNEEFRAVLVLREIDSCSYEAISQILELPIGTVRSRLARARIQLRDQLREVMVIDE